MSKQNGPKITQARTQECLKIHSKLTFNDRKLLLKIQHDWHATGERIEKLELETDSTCPMCKVNDDEVYHYL